MSGTRIALTVLLIIGGLSLFIHLLTRSYVVPPEQFEFDLAVPRSPPEARKIRNPVPETPEGVERGRDLYLGKGNCAICHGESGKGDGEGGEMMTPAPRNFTNPQFQRLRTDGELFWTIKEGIPGTGMFSYTPRMLTEEESWTVIRYLRTLEKKE